MKATSVYFFPNGGTACCNENGEQIPELQQSWLLMWVDFMKSKGYNPEDLREIHLPSGRVKLHVINEDGVISYNWENVRI